SHLSRHSIPPSGVPARTKLSLPAHLIAVTMDQSPVDAVRPATARTAGLGEAMNTAYAYSDYVRFLRSWVANPLQVAAVTPSVARFATGAPAPLGRWRRQWPRSRCNGSSCPKARHGCRRGSDTRGRSTARKP